MACIYDAASVGVAAFADRIEAETGLLFSAALLAWRGAELRSDCADRGTCVGSARVGAFGQIREGVEGACALL